MPEDRPRARGLARFLGLIERVGNRLPNPATLFVLLAVFVLLASSVAARLGIAVRHPRSGELVPAVDLLTAAGIRRAMVECVSNFTGFAPLGTVLAAMLGIGVAERCGLFEALLRGAVARVPRHAATATVIFAGIMSNVAADAGYLVLPPLAAAMFAALGRHPVAGIAAAFAGIAGGFSASLLPSTIDVLLAGLTQEAARLLHPEYEVQVVCNWYFFSAAVPLLTLLGTWVNSRFVEPRLGPYQPHEVPAAERLTPAERRGLKAAGWSVLASLGLFALLVIPPGAPLRETPPHGGPAMPVITQIKPFLHSMVPIVALLFFIPGMAYGVAVGKIRSDHDVARMTGETMASMGTYIVLAFAAAQFVAYFNWSNLGLILAVSAADALNALHFRGPPLFIAFMLLAMLFNLFIASSSAKWTALAPVFVPMFMLLGYSPEASQALYRVGDSLTNPITPLNPYFPLVLAFVQQQDRRMGIGSIVAMMLPYCLVFTLAWGGMTVAWLLVDLPLGPGAGLRYLGGAASPATP